MSSRRFEALFTRATFFSLNYQAATGFVAFPSAADAITGNLNFVVRRNAVGVWGKIDGYPSTAIYAYYNGKTFVLYEGKETHQSDLSPPTDVTVPFARATLHSQRR
jgi:hypothetical protein